MRVEIKVLISGDRSIIFDILILQIFSLLI